MKEIKRKKKEMNSCWNSISTISKVKWANRILGRSNRTGIRIRPFTTRTTPILYGPCRCINWPLSGKNSKSMDNHKEARKNSWIPRNQWWSQKKKYKLSNIPRIRSRSRWLWSFCIVKVHLEICKSSIWLRTPTNYRKPQTEEPRPKMNKAGTEPTHPSTKTPKHRKPQRLN